MSSVEISDLLVLPPGGCLYLLVALSGLGLPVRLSCEYRDSFLITSGSMFKLSVIAKVGS